MDRLRRYDNQARDKARQAGPRVRHHPAHGPDAFWQEAQASLAILDGLADGVVVVDAAGSIQYVNLAARQLFGVRRSARLAPPDWMKRWRCYRADGGAPCPPGECPLARAARGETVDDTELLFRRVGQDPDPAIPNRAATESGPDNLRSGMRLSVTARTLRDADGAVRGAIAVYRDQGAGERQAAQGDGRLHQLRALAGHLQTVREEERTRIAREIHDELGQMLTALKMDVVWLKERLTRDGGGDRPPRLAGKVEAMGRLLDATAQAVRRIATGLRPGILDHLGLPAAINWLAQDFHGRTGIRCTVVSDLKGPGVDGERSTVAFRIAQEGLTNVTRHARATDVQIGLHRDGDWLVLDIEDNGRGASDDDLAQPGALGVLGMRERAALAGGDLRVVGVPGKGTRVTARLPIVAAPAAAQDRKP